MPLIKKSNYYQFGKKGHKYKYKKGSKRSKTIARNKSLRQMRTIELSKHMTGSSLHPLPVGPIGSVGSTRRVSQNDINRLNEILKNRNINKFKILPYYPKNKFGGDIRCGDCILQSLNQTRNEGGSIFQITGVEPYKIIGKKKVYHFEDIPNIDDFLNNSDAYTYVRYPNGEIIIAEELLTDRENEVDEYRTGNIRDDYNHNYDPEVYEGGNIFSSIVSFLSNPITGLAKAFSASNMARGIYYPKTGKTEKLPQNR